LSRRADSEENDRQGTKHNGLRDRNFQKGEKGEVGGWRVEREEGRKSYLNRGSVTYVNRSERKAKGVCERKIEVVRRARKKGRKKDQRRCRRREERG